MSGHFGLIARPRCRFPGPDRVYHRETGGDAYSYLKRLRRPNTGHGIDQGEPGAHRALGVVLVRGRIAEERQDAIAHVARHVTLVEPDRLRADTLVGSDHVPQVFRIEAVG